MSSEPDDAESSPVESPAWRPPRDEPRLCWGCRGGGELGLAGVMWVQRGGLEKVQRGGVEKVQRGGLEKVWRGNVDTLLQVQCMW